ncbi:MAG: putative lipid II flippase FtsW [Geminicoccaceae bacterium]|nr:putative lipid II flippase FtsW [Geminicoccaceae bacterium]
MSSVFPRTDRSLLGTWWWTVDRVLLAGLVLLLLVGVVIVFAASPPVGMLRFKDPYYFILRHLVFAIPAALLILGCSLLAPLGVLRLAKGVFALGVVLMVLALLFGPEINGAHRWLRVGGVQLQPSEFVKPALVVLVAAIAASRPWPAATATSLALAAIVIGLLLLQPDLGMAAIVLATLGLQLFVAGLPWLVVALVAGIGIGGALLAYELFPRVSSRVDAYFAPPAEFTQIERALRAVASGGLFGRGPGEGIVKYNLPDAHTDFVFAATAEEFGILACLLIAALFAAILLRGLWRAHEAADRFCQIAAVGLAAQFGLQALVNMAVNLNLVPTKGMTLPFISYGGSSMLALGIATGWLLALTRARARLEPGR